MCSSGKDLPLQLGEKNSDDQSLKLALAISLLRSKIQQKQPPSDPPPEAAKPDSDGSRRSLPLGA
ncbi:hypothetical protein SAY87_029241 [Trapa incisa]|uniref:Uncharacterized protein n=1 Tax=Trapa incisa TaxID=236973 RepID=A0AAN7KVJ6_9MYRT|nr:hypothetical protein SAY87_029241 [Trapa incisa]